LRYRHRTVRSRCPHRPGLAFRAGFRRGGLRSREGELGEQCANYLESEGGDGQDVVGEFGEALAGVEREAERHAGLGQQSEAEPPARRGRRARERSAEPSAADLPDDAQQDIADDDGAAGAERADLQRGSAENEEQHEKRPLDVLSFAKGTLVVAGEVGEDDAEHDGGEQR
jgi:hypothetical protein